MNFALTLALIIIGTTLGGHLFARLGMPVVIGQMLVGVVLGPSLLNWVPLTHTLSEMSSIGVVILMFAAGMETDLKQLRRHLLPSVVVATFGVVLPLGVMYLFGRGIGTSRIESLFIGIIFAATSVSISVAVLREAGVLASRAGNIILGAAVLDDIIAVILLGVFTQQTSGGGKMLPKIGLQLLFFVLVWLGGRYLVPATMHLSKKLLIPLATPLTALAFCLALAGLAELVGLSDALGAFFAGIVVAQTKVRAEVDAAVNVVGNAVFIPVFFASIGLQLNLGAGINWGLTVLLTVLAVLTKLVGAGAGTRLCGGSWRDAYIVGAGMVSRGEMALIIAQLGRSAGLLSGRYYAMIITAIVAATLIAPLLLRRALHGVNTTHAEQPVTVSEPAPDAPTASSTH
ncbi:cation:proton antiporter [Lacticaseibacillus songhuajiangensis]|jgi:Kef-type K+ transport system membrane component KefB|uniref:cation:proton antiporter n=1 Tax=Lacticaseibacillus songhuajiangensis TaxID=1296539 RepID=UPI000F7B328E|nr:cation:proton antiporter [Lacticaseibacillus songhuajiangensis]